MGAYEELKEQRDFLLGNTWTNRPPKVTGEGCLAFRIEHGELVGEIKGVAPYRCLNEVLKEAGYLLSPLSWNDNHCRSAGEAISVLEEAMRLAKERGLTDEGKEG